jgi:hypothetical protein
LFDVSTGIRRTQRARPVPASTAPTTPSRSARYTTPSDTAAPSAPIDCSTHGIDPALPICRTHRSLPVGRSSPTSEMLTSRRSVSVLRAANTTVPSTICTGPRTVASNSAGGSRTLSCTDHRFRPVAASSATT